jgi:hypothetical protein
MPFLWSQRTGSRRDWCGPIWGTGVGWISMCRCALMGQLTDPTLGTFVTFPPHLEPSPARADLTDGLLGRDSLALLYGRPAQVPVERRFTPGVVLDDHGVPVADEGPGEQDQARLDGVHGGPLGGSDVDAPVGCHPARACDPIHDQAPHERPSIHDEAPTSPGERDGSPRGYPDERQRRPDHRSPIGRGRVPAFSVCTPRSS